MSKIEFYVAGTPAPAGSKRGFPIRRNDGSIGVAMAPDSKKQKPWMAKVSVAARQYIDKEMSFCESDMFYTPTRKPVRLTLNFCFLRPKSHYGTGKNIENVKHSAPTHHTKKPDLTKLIRAVEDALTGVVWVDDSQVIEQFTRKSYSDCEGVWIEVEEIKEIED